MITVVVSGSLAFGLLVGDGLDTGWGTVALLCSVAVVGCLTVPPRAREFFAGRATGTAPAAVVAAEAVVLLLCALLLADRPRLPAGGVGGGEVRLRRPGPGRDLFACFKVRRPATDRRPGRPHAGVGPDGGQPGRPRAGQRGGVHRAPVHPPGLALAVVGLAVAAPREPGFLRRAGDGDSDVTDHDDEYSPHPPDRRSPSPTTAPDSPPPSSARPPQRPPPPLSPPEPTGPPPLVRRPRPHRRGRRRPPRPARPRHPRPLARPPPAAGPPAADGCSIRPPAGFWPPERRRVRPPPLRGGRRRPRGRPTGLQIAPDLGIRFDATSWFPVLDGREQVRGAYLVSMAMFDDGGPRPSSGGRRPCW